MLFLNADGSVRAHHRIDAASGDLSTQPVPGEQFGGSLASLGDLDGDGTLEVAVGSPVSDRVKTDGGDLRILSLTTAGTVSSDVLIGEGSGGFGGAVDFFGNFGDSVARVDDLDGDGISELAVGESGADVTGFNEGLVWILLLAADGTVKSEVQITEGQGGFPGNLANRVAFGSSVLSPGDLTGDGVPDLLVGAMFDDDVNPGGGAVWFLALQPGGTVQSAFKFSGGGGAVPLNENYGRSLEALPDLDGNGFAEVIVGARQGYWVTGLGAGGAILADERIAKVDLPPPFDTAQADTVGQAIAYRGDEDQDGNPALAIGTLGNTTINDDGFVWITSISDLDPIAAFDAVVPADGSSPMTVTFQDLSTGAGLTSWSWDFGDGSSSRAQNPTHVYTKLGTYDVRLDVTGALGGSWVVQESLVVLHTALAQATIRNGSGSNPQVFDFVTLPIVGQDWITEIDATGLGASGLVFLVGYEGSLTGIPTVFGEVLVDPSSLLLAVDVGVLVNGSATMDIPIPNDNALLGCPASVQGLLNATGTLTNAIDLVLGT